MMLPSLRLTIHLSTYLLFLIAFVACNRHLPPSQAGNKVVADSLTAAINNLNAVETFNGFSVAVVNENGTLYQQGFGYADVATKTAYTTRTIQNIGSVSKTLVGVALVKAQDLGLLKLDDSINQYLPFRVANPAFPESVITIRQLATHTSSISDNDFYLTKNYYLQPNQELKGLPLSFDESEVFNPANEVVTLADYLQNVLTPSGKWYTADSYTKHRPGEYYTYSNVATALAAYIVEKASGKDFNEFTKQYILQPLKMTASGWRMEDVDKKKHSRLYANPQTALPFYRLSTYPDGNFITSVNDLSLYLAELIKGYKGHGKILSAAGYKELFQPQLGERNFTERNKKNPYSESYNVSVFIGFSYTGYIGHTGGDPGVASMMFFNPQTGLGRILIVNTSIVDKAGGKLFYSIWDELGKFERRLAAK